MRVLSGAVVMIWLALAGCGPKAWNGKIKGKLVHSSCASVVVQVLDSAYYTLGQDSWQQSPATPVYRHVFAVDNQCAFKRKNIAVGQEFYFTLTMAEEKDCVVCMMWDNPPSVKRKILVAAD